MRSGGFTSVSWWRSDRCGPYWRTMVVRRRWAVRYCRIPVAKPTTIIQSSAVAPKVSQPGATGDRAATMRRASPGASADCGKRP
ncbi:hypothetical protein SAMN04489727_6406 [Amycolatopsis tolypomycina]|uniref:Uncharacterized protein n=1 Tax=Amycolatopsis tolypomycina TaxID=208445 RepID=A0A1H4XZ31_9PSEU|nr:hypothetical protein SAMN04489727_6406 [Amycolatopsis tolypomycina]